MSEIKGIIKYVGKGTALALALCGGITIASNCALYKTTPPNSIQPVVPIETTIQQPTLYSNKLAMCYPFFSIGNRFCFGFVLYLVLFILFIFNIENN